MPEISDYAPGTFCWTDLSTTDPDGAKAFYSELFGWTSTDVPAGEAGTYTMLQLRGKGVGALYQMAEEKRSQGIPPHWLSYVSVHSADASAEKAKELGGSVLAGPFDVMEVGRMAVVQDPTGAIFALWQPKAHAGASLVNEPGAFCWNELMTRDAGAAKAFYAGLFGWSYKTDGGDEMGAPYTELINGGRHAGGMMQIQPEWGPMPSRWGVYIAVEDCDASVERAQGLGGKLMRPAMDIENVGRFAVLQDPQGASFAVIKLEMPQG